MAKFDIEKSGYSIQEVDDYIDTLTLKYEKRLSENKDKIFALKNENNLLNTTISEAKLREEELSKALIFAVEKAEQIERSAKKLYELEVRRMRLLYVRWKEVLDMMDRDTYNELVNGKFAFTMQDFEKDLHTVIEQNELYDSRHENDESVKENLKENSSNYIKNLLNRMDYLIATTSKSEEERKQKNKATKKVRENLDEDSKKENARLLNMNRRFNNIYARLGVASGASMLDDNISDDNAYFRNITGQIDNDQFDLDAILTPKEDLEEIMKAFDDINS